MSFCSVRRQYTLPQLYYYITALSVLYVYRPLCAGCMRGCNVSCQCVVIEVLCHVLFVLPSRVHISSVTLEHLKGAYKVEAGDGQSRDSYLKEHGIVTYLVINPKVQTRKTVMYLGCTE